MDRYQILGMVCNRHNIMMCQKLSINSFEEIIIMVKKVRTLLVRLLVRSHNFGQSVGELGIGYSLVTPNSEVNIGYELVRV